MLSFDILTRLRFEPEDIPYILECDKKYNGIIKPVSSEFMATNGYQNGKAYTKKLREEKYSFAVNVLNRVVAANKTCDNEYMSQLLFWLYCVPYAEEYYEKAGIDKEIFYDTFSDISCKVRECKERYGKIGTYSEWFYLHFDFIYFALGRLQYYVESYNHKPYKSGNYELNPGDLIYSCHIPSGAKLTPESCMESFNRAFEFFKDNLKDNILPIECRSWLIYPDYVGRAFPKDSNLEKFALMFDIIDRIDTGRNFKDCYHVFNRSFEGTTEGFPADNSLRRRFIEYINSGATFGTGTGIILYDGIKKKIINKPQD